MSTERERLSRRPVPSDGLQGDIRLMFHLIITRFHSPCTFGSPRNRNWRNPIADLTLPNTGSGVCLRLNVAIEVNSTSV